MINMIIIIDIRPKIITFLNHIFTSVVHFYSCLFIALFLIMFSIIFIRCTPGTASFIVLHM